MKMNDRPPYSSVCCSDSFRFYFALLQRLSITKPFPKKCKSRYHKGICFYIDKKVRRENSSRRYDKPSSNAVDHVQDALHSFLSLFNRIIAETVSEGNGLSLPGYTRNYPAFIFSSVMKKFQTETAIVKQDRILITMAVFKTIS